MITRDLIGPLLPATYCAFCDSEAVRVVPSVTYWHKPLALCASCANAFDHGQANHRAPVEPLTDFDEMPGIDDELATLALDASGHVKMICPDDGHEYFLTPRAFIEGEGLFTCELCGTRLVGIREFEFQVELGTIGNPLGADDFNEDGDS